MHSVNDFVIFVKSYNSDGNSLVNLPIYNDKICAYNDNCKVTTKQHFLRPTGRKGNIMKKKHESKTAWSTAHAWAIVDELFPGDYTRDDNSSERAGYPIFRATSEGSWAYICDLNSSLEINYDDGSTQRINIRPEVLEAEHQQARELKNLADKISWYQGELNKETEQRKKAEEARALAQGELEDVREALADAEAERDDLAKSVENALQHAEDMEAEAQKLAAEVLRLKARLFDLMEAQQGRTA